MKKQCLTKEDLDSYVFDRLLILIGIAFLVFIMWLYTLCVYNKGVEDGKLISSNEYIKELQYEENKYELLLSTYRNNKCEK